MECNQLDRISFQQRLSTRDELAKRWPALQKYICSADEAAAAVISTSKKAEGLLTDLPRGIAEEVLDFYNKVVIDGRYVDTMVENPSDVAAKLGLSISEDVGKAIEEIRVITTPGGSVSNTAVAVVVTVTVVVVIVKGTSPTEQLVLDQSGLVKF